MADTKISNLTALAAAPDSGDFVALVDTSASETKKLDAKYLVRDSAGSGAIVTGAYTLTLPATGTAVLLGTAQTLTALKKFEIGTAQIAANTFTRLFVSGDDATANDLELVGPATSQVRIQFSKPTQAGQAEIGYNMSTDVMRFVVAASEAARFNSSKHFMLGTTTDSGQLTVNQASTTVAQPVLHLTQADLSEGFIDYVGTSAASSTGPISSWTTGNTVQGHFAVEINGTRRWVRFYDNPTS